MTPDRRRFLKATGAAVSLSVVGACTPEVRPGSGTSTETSPAGLDGALLAAVGIVVLPGELGDEGRAAAVEAFRLWAADYEPVPELNHGYGTSEIRYGPPDPVPGWRAQLDALELEATKRFGVGFTALGTGDADALLRRHIGGVGAGVGSPLSADHVAVALLAHWLSTPDATDRCYGVRIAPQTCRGLDAAPRVPEALT